MISGCSSEQRLILEVVPQPQAKFCEPGSTHGAGIAHRIGRMSASFRGERERDMFGTYAWDLDGGLSAPGFFFCCMTEPNHVAQRNQMMADSDERQDAGQSLLHTKGRGGGDYVDDQGV